MSVTYTNNIPPGGKIGQALVKASSENYKVKWSYVGVPDGSGIVYRFGHGFKVSGDEVTVDTVNDFSGDNTLPISAAGVQSAIGNIEAILKTI